MFNVSALLLDDALKAATPMTNGTIHQTLRQFAPLSDNRLLQLVDCRELSKNTDQMPVTSVMMSLGTGRRKYRPTNKQNVFESRSWL